jgi:hypothetical protein
MNKWMINNIYKFKKMTDLLYLWLDINIYDAMVTLVLLMAPDNVRTSFTMYFTMTEWIISVPWLTLMYSQGNH